MYEDYDLYDDYETSDTSWYEGFSYKNLLPLTGDNSKAARIILKWYAEEEAYEDFDNAEEYVDYIEDDLPNMYEVAPDESEKRIVAIACPQIIEEYYEEDAYEAEDDEEETEEDILDSGYIYDERKSIFDSEDY